MALFVRETGDGGAAPVVLLHGFAGTHAVWREIQPRLAREVRTLAYDLPGHGGSFDYPEAGPAKVAAVAILADLEARGIDRAHLVGHSMGGAVAALMALLGPQRIASLTLLAPGGFGPQINHRLLTRWAAASDEHDIVSCLEGMFGWYSPVPDDATADIAADRALPGRVAMLSRIATGLARDGRQGQLPLDRIAGLAMPVTIAWGALDNVLPARQTEGLPGRFAVHLFPELGHMLPEEASDEMLSLISRSAGVGAEVGSGRW